MTRCGWRTEAPTIPRRSREARARGARRDGDRAPRTSARDARASPAPSPRTPARPGAGTPSHATPAHPGTRRRATRSRQDPVEVVAHEDQQLVAIEQLEPALELVGVQASRYVAAAEAARHAGVRVRAQPLEHTRKVCLFAVQCLLERAGLTAPAQLHLEGGVGALDRIAKEGDQLHLRIERVDPLWRAWVEQACGGRLADGRGDPDPSPYRALVRDERKLSPIPPFASCVVLREVLHLLDARGEDRRVLREVVMERGGPGLLRSDDEVRRARARRRGGTPHRSIGSPECLPCSVRDASANPLDEPAGWLGGHALKHRTGYVTANRVAESSSSSDPVKR